MPGRHHWNPQRGVSLYRAALQECRRLGLRYLQPGLFLCPGPRGDVPLLWFFPIDGAPGDAAHSNKLLGGRPATYQTVASVLSAVDGTARIDGRPVEVVLGVPLGEDRERPFYPGDVPSGDPPENFRSDRFFELPVFAPPRIDPSGAKGIPDIGLDEVLVELLKDVL